MWALAIGGLAMSKRRHVFISHHHADDGLVESLTTLLSARGFEIRNSSIRANPANLERLNKGMVSDATIKRLLRMKMSWASTVVVLIGRRTHSREWVNWEIEKANSLGKRIIGVYERGGTDFEIPPALEDHATVIVNWNSDSIIDAIEGRDNTFKAPDGGVAKPLHAPVTSRC
jgi:MTH538 TIR-like domain (DUF1863)